MDGHSKRMRNWGIAVVVFLCAACTRTEPANSPDTSRNFPSGEELTLPLCVNVSGEEGYGDKGTKAIVDENTPADIQNMLVMQYDGESPESCLMGCSSLERSDISIDGTSVTATVRLLSTPAPSTVFFLANCKDKNFSAPPTLGELVASGMKATNEKELFGFDGTDHHMIFSGNTVMTSVQKGSIISADLYRNISKVTLRVVNSSYNAPQKIKVESVYLGSIPEDSYFFPSYGNPAVFPAFENMRVRSSEVKSWPSDKEQGKGSVSEDFVFYVPVNKRGTVVNDDPAAKNKYAPKNATYAFINCSYSDGSEIIALSYKIFLGKNLENDFNLENNTSNTFTIEIKSKGNANIDSRITDYGPVDFTPSSVSRANCYILNPPVAENYWRTFSIPVDRVDTFWGKGKTADNAPYEYAPNYVLSPSNRWIAEILWSDFDIDPSTNFRFAGGGTTYEGNGLEPIKVQVPKGVSGNVLITIKRKDAALSPVLWSWHLWITDYNPDDAIKFQIPSTTVYEYAVSGGMVHRPENDSYWGNSRWIDSFIMDRNLGALSDNLPATQDSPGVLYYQQGRKDPLWKGRSVGRIIDYSSPEVQETASEPTKAVRYSVHNPDVFIKHNKSDNYFWTCGNKYNPLKENKKHPDIIWNDPLATGENATDSAGNHKKSIFDPCPPGWRVPELKLLYFLYSTSWTGDGRLYGKGNIFFPAAGYFSESGSFVSFGTNGYYVYSNDNIGWSWAALRITFDSGSVQEANNTKVRGWTVRCVSKKEDL